MDATTIHTVLGPVKPSELGRTLTHEHLFLNFNHFYVPPPDRLEHFFEEKINLRNVGFVKQYPYSSKYNISLDEDIQEALVEDVKLFKKFGGGTIVENTSHELKRNIPLLKRISEETDVHVITGTGYYVALVQSASVLAASEEQMYDLMMTEMTMGCEGSPEVKAGFIGEVGSTWPIEDFEKRAIRATAEVQAQLGCPVSFHPGRDPAAPFEILRIHLEAGGDPTKTIMSHLDRTLTKEEDLLEFAKSGCYCQFDLFGIECSFYQFNPTTDMLSDAQRIDRVKLLRDDGRLNRVLLSHDIHTKHRLVEFGGHGYSHILNNVLPKMAIKGFTPDEIDTVTIDNPKTWLSS